MEQIKNNKKNYRHLLLKALLFLMLVIAADFITGSVLKHFYFRQSSGWEYRTKYSIEDTKAEVLIFGASRAQQQYNPLFIEDNLHQTCYNVGRDGMPLFYHYAVLQAVLKRYTPKMIILDCEYGALRDGSSSYERIAAAVSSGDTSVVASFAAVPEPSSVLFGLAMFGVALTNRARGRAMKAV